MRTASLSLLLFLGACAPSAVAITPDHPASPNAPIGRLAGPPPALQPGVVEPTQPTPQPTGHEHHQMPAPTGHEHHQAPAQPVSEPQPEKLEPKKTEPKKSDPKKSEPKKVEPKKTEPKKTEPKKTEPKKAEPQPDPHKGHTGHEHH